MSASDGIYPEMGNYGPHSKEQSNLDLDLNLKEVPQELI